jgi:hypothetical protein
MQAKIDRQRLNANYSREEQFLRNQTRRQFEADLRHILMSQAALHKDHSMVVNFYKPQSKDSEDDEPPVDRRGHMEKLSGIRQGWQNE